MPHITFTTFAGATRTVDVADGTTVMEAAVDNGVPGIDGDCGGNCACATCQVYVDEAWLARTGSRSDMESAMLDLAAGVQANSRLGCQIVMSAALDGLTVTTPESQH